MNVKRKELTLKEKLDVLDYASANKCTQLQLAKKFEISQTQVSKLLKNKEKIIDAKKCNANLNLKRKRSGKESEMEKELLHWFSETRTLNAPVTDVMISRKAEAIARQLNINSFKATNGWLYRWKKRNQIPFKRIRGEAKDGKQHSDGALQMDTALQMVNNNISLHVIKDFLMKYKDTTNIQNENLIPDEIESLQGNRTEERITNYVNCDANLEACDESSRCDLSKSEIQEDDGDSGEIYPMNRIPSAVEVINACYTIRCFLETKQNVDFKLFNKMENQVTNLLQLESENSKIPDFYDNESACAYKYGEMKIKELRRRAEAALGKDFDIKEFHDVVIRNNGPLELVEKQVDHYIATMSNAEVES